MAAHRYWRLRSIDNNGGSCTTITELIFATTPGGSTVCTGGTAIRSSEQAGWEAPKAFDGISGDQGWASAPGDILDAWVGYDLGVGNSADVVEARVMSRTLSPAGLQQTPSLFFIQYSDDGTNWYQRGVGSGIQTGWTANQTRTFSIGNSDDVLAELVYLDGIASSRETTIYTSRPISFRSGLTGGPGRFAGSVVPGTAPIVGVWIKAFDAATRQPAGHVVTNSIGEWEMTGLRAGREYFLVAENPDAFWEYTVSSRRVPSVSYYFGGRSLTGEVSQATLIRPTWTATSNLTAAGFRSSGQYTIRQSIPRSRFYTPSTKFKLNLQAYTSGATVINSAYLGIRSGYTDDFVSAPTQIFFGGNPGVTIATNTNVQTDEITLTVNPGEDLLLSVVVDGSSAANMLYTAPVLDNTWSSYAKAAVSEGSTITVSGYTEQLNVCSMVRNFEYFATI